MADAGVGLDLPVRDPETQLAATEMKRPGPVWGIVDWLPPRAQHGAVTSELLRIHARSTAGGVDVVWELDGNLQANDRAPWECVVRFCEQRGRQLLGTMNPLPDSHPHRQEMRIAPPIGSENRMVRFLTLEARTMSVHSIDSAPSEPSAARRAEGESVAWPTASTAPDWKLWMVRRWATGPAWHWPDVPDGSPVPTERLVEELAAKARSMLS